MRKSGYYPSAASSSSSIVLFNRIQLFISLQSKRYSDSIGDEPAVQSFVARGLVAGGVYE